MAAQILGPTDAVPCDNPVVITCVIENGTFTCPNHPAFTNDAEFVGCASAPEGGVKRCKQTHTVVFCSAAQFITGKTRFVGVIASAPTVHGKHAHVAVYIRGCVTMACHLGDMKDVRRSMVTVGFDPEKRENPVRFIGIGDRIVPPVITKVYPCVQDHVVGVVVEKGRAPSNEIRVILRPGMDYRLTTKDLVESTDTPDDIIVKLTCREALIIAPKVLAKAEADALKTAFNNLAAAVAATTLTMAEVFGSVLEHVAQ